MVVTSEAPGMRYLVPNVVYSNRLHLGHGPNSVPGICINEI